MEFVKIYITSLVTFLALDSVWLGLVAPKFYKKYIGDLMAEKANLFAAGLFYLVFISGLVFFVIQPALKEGSWQIALTRGALFGLVSYATFDLTNQAVIKNWPWMVTGVDLLWGTFITATVATASFFIYRALFL